MIKNQQPTGRLLLFVLLVAVLAFGASTSAGIMVLGSIHRDAAGIARNAAPSTLQLSEMRLNLRLLETHLGQMQPTDSGFVREERIRRVEEARRELLTNWRAYQGNPAYSGEKGFWKPVERELTRLDGAVNRLLHQLEPEQARRGAAPASEAKLAAIKIGRYTVSHSADRLSAELNVLTDFNVAHARAHAQAIDEARERHLVLAVLFDGGAIALTVVTFIAVYRRLRRREAELERKTAELDQFAGRVAHDLRNPLSAAGLALEFIAQHPALDERMQRTAERGHRSVLHAREIVDALLSFARAGAVPEPGAWANAAQVVEGALNEVRMEAEARGVVIRNEVTDPTLRVACPAGLLAVVLENLVHNSIKHMPERDPRMVTLRVGRRGGSIRLEVEDTGSGVPVEVAHRLFEPFIRANSNKPGLGLGLATVRRIANAYGGRVGVEPGNELGSVFWVELPEATCSSTKRPLGRVWPLKAARSPSRA